MSSDSAYPTCLATRSIRARTDSPGIAPLTSTICPPSRAIMRPPAAGLSMASDTICPGVSIETRPPRERSLAERDGRQPKAFANQPIDGRGAGAGERVGGHSGLERRQIGVRLARQLLSFASVEGAVHLLEQFAIERREPIDQLPTPLAAHTPGLGACPLELFRHAIDERIELHAEPAARPRGRKPKHHALQVSRQRLLRGHLVTLDRRLRTLGRRLRTLGRRLRTLG